MTTIQLLDINTGIVHTLEVSEEDAEKANEGSVSVCNDTNNMTQQTSVVQEDLNISEEKDVFHWPQEAILLLVMAYIEHEHLIKSGKISMKKFWNIIKSELNRKGYSVTDTQCKSKMAGMKNTYKSVKDHNTKSGNNHKRWQYFDVMDKHFNNKPWVAPVLTLDSESVDDPSPLSEITNTDHKKRSSSPSTSKMPSKRLKQHTLLEKLVNVTEENTIQRQKMHEESIARQDRLLDILEKMVTK